MKVLAKYAGGIHSLVQASIRSDGVLSWNLMNKTPYGYKYGPWKEKGKVGSVIPQTLQAGFSTLFKSDFPCRLPKG